MKKLVACALLVGLILSAASVYSPGQDASDAGPGPYRVIATDAGPGPYAPRM